MTTLRNSSSKKYQNFVSILSFAKHFDDVVYISAVRCRRGDSDHGLALTRYKSRGKKIGLMRIYIKKYIKKNIYLQYPFNT